MATATRARRTRQSTTTTNVQLSSGRGVVHRAHPVTTTAFPACRTGEQTSRAVTRYGHTTKPVDCEKCLEYARADQGARDARQAGRATAAERTPTGDPYKGKTNPRATRARRNGKAQQEAEAQAEAIIADETATVLAKRDDQWADERKPGCSDDDYALAVQVRTLRAAGGAWWAIAHAMGLKGSGPSVKQGKTGAAYARRLWERAWGPTYKDTSVERDTKARKVERAITQPGKSFFTSDTPNQEVLDAVRGKEIEWTTRLAAADTVVCSIQKAIVSPMHKFEIVVGAKGRVLKFYELPEPGSRLSGSLRSVYVDRIERVGL